jgi:hypothetical protein
MKTERAKNVNPLSDLISDEIYELLRGLDIITEKLVRDYQIRKKFKQLRAQKIPPREAINIIIKEQKEDLHYDTVRKIAYEDPAEKNKNKQNLYT